MAQAIDVVVRQVTHVTAESSLLSSEYPNAYNMDVANHARGTATSTKLSTLKYISNVT